MIGVSSIINTKVWDTHVLVCYLCANHLVAWLRYFRSFLVSSGTSVRSKSSNEQTIFCYAEFFPFGWIELCNVWMELCNCWLCTIGGIMTDTSYN